MKAFTMRFGVRSALLQDKSFNLGGWLQDRFNDGWLRDLFIDEMEPDPKVSEADEIVIRIVKCDSEGRFPKTAPSEIELTRLRRLLAEGQYASASEGARHGSIQREENEWIKLRLAQWEAGMDYEDYPEDGPLSMREGWQS